MTRPVASPDMRDRITALLRDGYGKGIPTPGRLRTVLDLDPATGELRWRRRPRAMFAADGPWKTWNKRFAGKAALTALTVNGGYRHGYVFAVKLRAHRVAWALHYGAWPAEEIDHIDGDTQNNRIENLRCVGRGENSRNMPMPKHNNSGAVGVSWSPERRKWTAQIWVRGKAKSLGRFASFNDARRARKAAERELGYHENHGRRG